MAMIVLEEPDGAGSARGTPVIWCRNLGACFPGDGTGPSGGQCTAANWAFFPRDCAVDASTASVPVVFRPSHDAAAASGRLHRYTSAGRFNNAPASSDT